MNLRASRKQEARVGFETARSTCWVVLLECLWSLRFELLAWEEAGSAADVEDVARRLCEQARDESPPFLAWGEYGVALAALLKDEWATVILPSRLCAVC